MVFMLASADPYNRPFQYLSFRDITNGARHHFLSFTKYTDTQVLLALTSALFIIPFSARGTLGMDFSTCLVPFAVHVYQQSNVIATYVVIQVGSTLDGPRT